MYVCVCAYVCMNTFVTYTHTHTCIHTNLHSQERELGKKGMILVCMCVCMYVYIHTDEDGARGNRKGESGQRSNIHTYIHTYRHTYIHTYTYNDIHTYIQVKTERMVTGKEKVVKGAEETKLNFKNLESVCVLYVCM
jgi:hypothetical protein